jgi:hypothetical protein
MKQAIDLDLLTPGDAVIAVQGWTGGLGHSNTLRVTSLLRMLLICRSSKLTINALGLFARYSFVAVGKLGRHTFARTGLWGSF